MAEIACRYATDPIFTSDNPRSEDPLAILKDMEDGVTGKIISQFLIEKRPLQQL